MSISFVKRIYFELNVGLEQNELNKTKTKTKDLRHKPQWAWTFVLDEIPEDTCKHKKFAQVR